MGEDSGNETDPSGGWSDNLPSSIPDDFDTEHHPIDHIKHQSQVTLSWAMKSFGSALSTSAYSFRPTTNPLKPASRGGGFTSTIDCLGVLPTHRATYFLLVSQLVRVRLLSLSFSTSILLWSLRTYRVSLHVRWYQDVWCHVSEMRLRCQDVRCCLS